MADIDREIDYSAEKKTHSPKAESAFYKFIALGVLLVIVVAIVAFGTKPPVTKGTIVAALDSYGEKLSENLRSSGAEGSFTFRDVSINGSGASAKVVIHNPVIEYSHLPGAGEDVVTLSTEYAIMPIGGFVASAKNIVFPKPFTLESGNKPPLLVTFTGETPPSYNIAQSEEKELHSLNIPNTITISPKGLDTAETNPVTITYAKEPIIHYAEEHTTKAYVTSIKFSDIDISHSGTVALFNAQNLALNSTGTPSSDGINFKTNVAVSGLEAVNSYKLSDVLDITLALTGKKREVTQPPIEKTFNEEIYDTVNLKIESKQVPLAEVNGNMHFINTDQLPSGNLNLTLHSMEWVRSQLTYVAIDKNILEQAFTKITDTSLYSNDVVNFSVRREKGGTLYLGNTAFETFITLILSKILLNNNTSEHYSPENSMDEEVDTLHTMPPLPPEQITP